MVRVAVLVCLVLGIAGQALAHSGPSLSVAAKRGIPIDNLTHGQMAVIADYRSEILELAARHAADADAAFRQVRAFAAIQYGLCFWNLGPGSVTDEDSPFNGCMHAHLAAVRDLLVRMRTMPAAADAVAPLVAHVDEAMMLQGASLVLCRYSAEGFDTANPLDPDWPALWTHPPTLAALTALLMVVGGALAAVRRYA